MTARKDFSDRITRIEKRATASPAKRAQYATPTPGAGEDEVIAEGLEPVKRKGGFGSLLSGMVLGLALIGGGLFYFSDELEKMGPEGAYVASLFDKEQGFGNYLFERAKEYMGAGEIDLIENDQDQDLKRLHLEENPEARLVLTN